MFSKILDAPDLKKEFLPVKTKTLLNDLS